MSNKEHLVLLWGTCPCEVLQQVFYFCIAPACQSRASSLMSSYEEPYSFVISASLNHSLLQASRVLRPGPSLIRTSRAGPTAGTTSSPSGLCYQSALFTLWGAVQLFLFLLGSTLASQVGIEVLWRFFPPKGLFRGDNPFS